VTKSSVGVIYTYIIAKQLLTEKAPFLACILIWVHAYHIPVMNSADPKAPANSAQPQPTPHATGRVFSTPGRLAGIAVLLATLGALIWLLTTDYLTEMTKPLAEFGLIILCAAIVAVGAGFFKRKP
jgi:hypothetical protein